MEVHLKNTSQITTLVINGVDVPARVWEGVTGNGVRCHAYITRIAVHEKDDAADFERDLKEQTAPTLPSVAIPLRMIL